MSDRKGHIEVKRGSNRNFGIVFAAFFAIIAIFPFVFGSGSPRYWLLAIAASFLLIAIFRPSVFQKPNILWFKFGMVLGAIIAPIVMCIIYFITVAPIGILMRLAGKDLLSLKIEPDAETYWIERVESDDSMKNQF